MHALERVLNGGPNMVMCAGSNGLKRRTFISVV